MEKQCWESLKTIALKTTLALIGKSEVSTRPRLGFKPETFDLPVQCSNEGPDLRKTGTKSNRNENRNFHHVYMRQVRNHEISPTRVTPALALSRHFVSVLYFCAHISNRSEMQFVFTFMPV